MYELDIDYSFIDRFKDCLDPLRENLINRLDIMEFTGNESAIEGKIYKLVNKIEERPVNQLLKALSRCRIELSTIYFLAGMKDAFQNEEIGKKLSTTYNPGSEATVIKLKSKDERYLNYKKEADEAQKKVDEIILDADKLNQLRELIIEYSKYDVQYYNQSYLSGIQSLYRIKKIWKLQSDNRIWEEEDNLVQYGFIDKKLLKLKK